MELTTENLFNLLKFESKTSGQNVGHKLILTYKQAERRPVDIGKTQKNAKATPRSMKTYTPADFRRFPGHA